MNWSRWKKFWSFTILFASLTTAGIMYSTADDPTKVIKKVPTTHKVVAFTFDDGPHPRTTPEVLAVLRDKGVRATFFVLGRNVELFPEIVAQAVADGHEIGSHSYSHKILNKLTPLEYEQDIDRADTVISLVAPKPILFRPPGGGYNDDIVDAAYRRGYTTILWSVDAGDWRRLPPARVVKNVMNGLKRGNIILMHDGQHTLPTARALSKLIDKLREEGYSILTVSELLQYYEVRYK